ncbi:MAG: hypothetical protein ABIJ21_07200 [Nanoarchaeota archaeon]
MQAISRGGTLRPEDAMLYLQMIGLEETEKEEINTPIPAPVTPTKPPAQRHSYCFVAEVDGYTNKLVCKREHNPDMGKAEIVLPGDRVFADIGSLVQELLQVDKDAALLILNLIAHNLLQNGYAQGLLHEFYPAQDEIPEPIYAKHFPD